MSNFLSRIYDEGAYFGQVNDQNEPHGFGTLTYDEATYCGTFYNGLEHGSGTMTAADGRTYTATYLHGKKTKEYPDPDRHLQHLHSTMLLIIRELSSDLETQISDTTQTHLLFAASIERFHRLAQVAIDNGVDVEIVNGISRNEF